MSTEDFLDLIRKNSVSFDKVNYLKNTTYPIVLWGAGSLAVSVYNFLKKNKIRIVACLVDIENLEDDYFFDIPIYNLSKIKKLYDKVDVIIGHSRYEKGSLIKEKNENINEVIYFCNICYGQYKSVDLDFIKKNIYKYIEAYEYLNDDRSKRAFIAYINSKMNDDIRFIQECIGEEKNNYFNNELFKINHKEIYLDLGAYNGDTIREFLNESYGKYKKIIAFEPEKNSFLELLNTYGNSNNDMVFYNMGAYDENKTVYFNDDAESSSLVLNDMGEKIKVVKIDDEVKDSVSVIKINYMQGVLETLRGAENIIKENMPKIAIVVGFDNMTVINVILYFKWLNNRLEGTQKKYDIILRFNAVMPARLVFFAHEH